jgi:hypothetical protein
MRGSIAVAMACCVAFCAAGGGPAEERLDLSRESSGVLEATIRTDDGGGTVTFNYIKDGCYFSADHSEPCFAFSAVDGTEPMAISGCTLNTNAKLGIGEMAGCRVAGFKAVHIVLVKGGTLALYGATGHHESCSPLPVSIEAHGDAYHVGAWDGCTETISCPNGTGQLDVDAEDIVNKNCDPAFVIRH